MEWSYAVASLISLLAILDPIGAVPTFLAVCPEQSDAKKIAVKASAAVCITLVTFALFGPVILDLFGITLPAFRAGGGVVILLMAVAMLHGSVSRVKQTPQEVDELSDREAVAIVPLAIPLLAGPGAITTAMLLAHDATSWPRKITLLLVILTCGGVVMITLSIAGRLKAWLGHTGINICNRVMGLILVAVGMQFIGDGLRELLPGLAG